MEDVSPTKWHLSLVSWFFETFILKPYLGGYKPIEARYEHPSTLTTTGLARQSIIPQLDFPADGGEVYAYRKHDDDSMLASSEKALPSLISEVAPLVLLGVNHEQQHQELMVTDIK
jgi:hypothetical protein